MCQDVVFSKYYLIKSLTILQQLNKKKVKYRSQNEQPSWNILQKREKLGPFTPSKL